MPFIYNWRSRNLGCDLYCEWTYRRNYKAEIHDYDGDFSDYRIYENSDSKNPKLILEFSGFDSYVYKYCERERCEQILAILAKRQDLILNDHELSCAKYYPENINHVEKTDYELSKSTT